MLYIAFGLGLLALAIGFHEFGHFLLGKLFNFKIKTFSIGFGPKLLKFRIGETEYGLSLLPLGGYVEFVGEKSEETSDPNDPDKGRYFTAKPAWQRILVLAAGPGFNFFKAAVCYSWMFYSLGVVVSTLNVINEVGQNSPAEKVGLRRGDRIVSINGQRVDSWDKMRILIATSEGKNLNLEVARGKQTVNLTVTPKQAGNYYILGIAPAIQQRKIQGLSDAAKVGVKETGKEIKSQVWSIKQLVTGRVSPKNISGPVGILKEAGKSAEVASEIGWQYILGFLIFLNVGLGVMNLLPIPMLDGGGILFCLLEMIRGKPLSKAMQDKISYIGLVALLMLFIYSSSNDFSRLGK